MSQQCRPPIPPPARLPTPPPARLPTPSPSRLPVPSGSRSFPHTPGSSRHTPSISAPLSTPFPNNAHGISRSSPSPNSTPPPPSLPNLSLRHTPNVFTFRQLLHLGLAHPPLLVLRDSPLLDPPKLLLLSPHGSSYITSDIRSGWHQTVHDNTINMISIQRTRLKRISRRMIRSKLS
jgi:hypothetical protein